MFQREKESILVIASWSGRTGVMLGSEFEGNRTAFLMNPPPTPPRTVGPACLFSMSKQGTQSISSDRRLVAFDDDFLAPKVMVIGRHACGTVRRRPGQRQWRSNVRSHQINTLVGAGARRIRHGVLAWLERS